MASKNTLDKNVCSGILIIAPNQEIYQYNSLYQQIKEWYKNTNGIWQSIWQNSTIPKT